MSFTLTLPEDNALVLNAMSRALAEIAQGVPSHGTAPVTVAVGEMSRTTNEPVEHTPTDLKVSVADVECVPAEYEPVQYVPDTSEECLARLIEETKRDDLNDDASLPDLDKDGLPWDNRINSTPASVTASGVWKMRRKPKDMDDNQWAEYIETVRNELTNLMSIEVNDDGLVADTDNVDTGIVVDEPLIPVDDIVDVDTSGIEPVAPPVTPGDVFGTTAVEPVAPVTPPAITTFPQLMTWLTGMTGKVTVEQVNGALAEWNMNSVALLAKRPDLIPAFITKIEGLLCA